MKKPRALARGVFTGAVGLAGGLADWTRKLLADEIERFLASGIGRELFQKI